MARIAADDAQLLPHNREAEESVIGSMLIDPDAVMAARDAGLEPGDFYVQKLGVVYAAMLSLSDRMEPVDLVTLCDALEGRGNGNGNELEIIGGAPYLTTLIINTPTSMHVDHYAKIVKADSRRRRIISAAGDIAAQAHAHDGPVEDLLDAVSAVLFAAMERPEAESHLYGTDDTLWAYEVLLQQRAELAASPDQFPTKAWLPTLDFILGTLAPGELHAITAITSVGKTIYMEQVAEANAMRGQRVAYYHLELTHTRMQDRRMARHSGISLQRLVGGYNGSEVARAQDSIRRWHNNLVYVHCPGWTAERIAADMMRLHARGECDLAVVDYLNKVGWSERVPGAWNEASHIGHKVEVLKNCVEKIEIPLVLGAQLNRQYKGRDRPTFDDLKGSSDIEQKVNQIVVLHRPYDRQGGDRFGELEQIDAYVDKNTNGGTGKATLWHRMGRFRLECQEERALATEPVPL